MIPTGLLVLAAIIMIFIAYGKPRSRHHAALLFILESAVGKRMRGASGVK
jgi:hypothetical protein